MFNSIPIKVPARVFCRYSQDSSKIYVERKKNKKTIWKKNKMKGITLSDGNTYTATVITIVCRG